MALTKLTQLPTATIVDSLAGGAYVVPYERAMALAPQDETLDEPLSSNGSEPLVPILSTEAGQVDPVALTTWHQALSNTLSVEVPHDLMGLWLYPSQGGIALVGPSELSADDLPIPIPSPHLTSEQLSTVEQIVKSAGYASATCLPVRFGKRDVALLLVADLQAERYGPAERVLLQCVARKVAPMLGRIARQWVPSEGASSRQQERIASLLGAVAQANREAASPQRFLNAVSRALATLLPHDHIELLVPNAEGDQYFRLAEHVGGPLWVDPSLAISRKHLDITAIFEGRTDLLVADTYGDDRWPRGFLTASDNGGADVRAVVGAQLSFGAGAVAYLLVGSVGPELYGADDVELLTLLAGLIGPQIGSFVRPVPVPAPLPVPVAVPTPRAPERAVVQQPSAESGTAELLFRIAGLLATTSDPAVATTLLAQQGLGLFEYSELTIALKLTEGERVVLLQPGERRKLLDLPLVPVAGTALARVLRGESPNAFSRNQGESRLIVPLRVAGKVHGCLVFSARPPAELSALRLPAAQRLADIVAAHFELLRRAALQPRPFSPSTQHVQRM
jgi:hypothetical protein